MAYAYRTHHWENDRQGGYILNEVMRGHDMVRRGDPTSIQGENPLDFEQDSEGCLPAKPFIVGVWKS